MGKTIRKKSGSRASRRVTPAYLFFYALFSEHAWGILFGILLSCLATSFLAARFAFTPGETILIGIMIVPMGWIAFSRPARIVAVRLRRIVTKQGG